jgi:hypothetical protein
MQLIFSQTQDSPYTNVETVKNKLLGNSFMILVQGKKVTDGKNVVVGVYYSLEAGYPKGKDANVSWMRWNPDCFLSYFEEGGQMVHFKDSSKGHFIELYSTPLVTLETGWNQEGGDISILFDEDEKLNLSFTSNVETIIDFSRSPMSEEKIAL